MIDNPPEPTSDIWSDWLLHRRHGDNPTLDRTIRAEVDRYAERVLDGARLEPGMTLADVGAGEGLIAFRAIDRVGPSLRVVLTDISAPILRHAESLAINRKISDRCSFHHCAADHLTSIDDGSVDVVTTRAVLAYVADKTAALREFRRVLKPGGRISIAEPIFRDEALAVSALRNVIDARPPGYAERFMPLLHRWKAAQFPDTPEKIAKSSIANYSERDLVRFAQVSGFADIHLEFHIDAASSIIPSWEVFLSSSPHPWAPSLGVILAEQFTLEERQYFEPVIRSAAEASQFGGIARIAYLTARKPPA